jgi:hypothetical protein
LWSVVTRSGASPWASIFARTNSLTAMKWSMRDSAPSQRET